MTDATAELDMLMEMDAVKERYNSFFNDGEIEVDAQAAPGVTANVVKGRTNEAWVTLYAQDGTASTVTTESAKRKILMRQNGQPVWRTKPDPRFQYITDPVTRRPVKVSENRLLCLLHPEHPDREWLDSIGLVGQVCDPQFGRHVSTIPSQFQLELHMKTKHKQEWAAIERERLAQREAEGQRLQRETLEAMRSMATPSRKGAA